MTRTGYYVLKDHFDKLFHGGYPGNGLEQLKDTYEYAFGNRMYMYDIYQTNLRVSNNPINVIATFVGPNNPDIKSGIVPCIDDIYCVSIFDKNYLRGLTSENINDYAEQVYHAMVAVISADSMHDIVDPISRMSSPYSSFLNFCPLYFTFHHIKAVAPELICNCSVFNDILDRYVCAQDDIDKILNSLYDSPYSTSFEDIYSTITCKNTVELNW